MLSLNIKSGTLISQMYILQYIMNVGIKCLLFFVPNRWIWAGPSVSILHFLSSRTNLDFRRSRSRGFSPRYYVPGETMMVRFRDVSHPSLPFAGCSDKRQCQLHVSLCYPMCLVTQCFWTQERDSSRWVPGGASANRKTRTSRTPPFPRRGLGCSETYHLVWVPHLNTHGSVRRPLSWK